MVVHLLVCCLLGILIHLVLFHLICLFRTVLVLIYLYLFDLVEILIFGVKRLNFSTVRKWCSHVYSHLRFIISHIKNINSAVIFGMRFIHILYLLI